MGLQMLIFSPSHNCSLFNPSLTSFLKPISLSSSHRNASPSFTHATLSQQTAAVENKELVMHKLDKLKQKVEASGIRFIKSTPGEYSHLICPKCHGGQSLERSLSFHIIKSGEFAIWRCFKVECGWAGQMFVDDRKVVNQVSLSKETPRLEPLGDEVIAYFADRMISKATLEKNCVMQLSGSNQNIIAFKYMKNGVYVGCKYRTINEKRFWQEKSTEKILYGIDDIKEGQDIILVEGETDKLSMDEAGVYNCVSVPDGAPQGVSYKELTSLEKDTGYQYLWNAKEYFDKASRIILATDNDIPGQALAEEIARRLGKERCWQVRWPKKDDTTFFKDANEVLKCLGADALRDIVNNAQSYETTLD